MRDDPECRCYVDHLIAEHRRLHALVRQTHAAMARSIGPDEQSFAEVRRVLNRLRMELVHHFAEEEDGGCLEEAVSRCPRLAPEAHLIEADHGQILSALDRLVAQFQAEPPTPTRQLALQRDLGELCRHLREHEHAENQLLAQGFGINVNGEENEQPALMLDV